MMVNKSRCLIAENIDEPDENVNINNVFEQVRQLMLSENILGAVKQLREVMKLLPNCEDFDNMTMEDKEQCLLLFLAKIFTESEDSIDLVGTNECESQSIDKADDRNLMKQKEDVKNKKRIVSYFEVRRVKMETSTIFILPT